MSRFLRSPGGAYRLVSACRTRFACWLWVSLLVLGSGGCSDSENRQSAATEDSVESLALRTEQFTGDLDQIRERRVLRALVVPSSTDFFLAGAKIEGLQVQLLREYQKQLNAGIERAADRVHIHYLPVPFERLLPELQAGRGDIAAALLTVTPEREAQVSMISGAAMGVNEVVVTRKDADPIASIEDLAGREVHVMRGSSYAIHLEQLNERLAALGKSPVILREADPLLLSDDLLEMVNAGVIEVTVIDDYKARLWAQLLPDIVVREDLVVHEGGKLGWAVRRDNPLLQASLRKFVGKVRQGTLLGNILMRRYLEETGWIRNPVSASERKKLDRLMVLFERYGEMYDIDPFALLAQAYHESGLDHDRRSHRGAVGIMQLLPSTARDPNVGIPDIRDLENNVHAGAKYLAFIRDRYFADPELDPADRMAFTWAAYNAGPAKVREMRDLAAEMGLDRNRWFGNVEMGAGRLVGRETVKYVADVKKYYVAYRMLSEHRSLKQQIR